MLIVSSVSKMSALSKSYRKKGLKIGFVPTMGALHEGHLSLMRRARRENDIVAVSIFINPAQFGPREDLKKYPRDLKKDVLFCRKEGVDVIFCPNSIEIYPSGYKTYCYVEDLSKVLCGKTRPTHFRGVVTVVLKLFNIIMPDRAYFGQKDAQQVAIIRKMVTDLNVAVVVKVMPIVRQDDGLAVSSRNVYLKAKERSDALVLSQSLALARKLFFKRIRNSAAVINRMSQLIKSRKGVKIDYISVVDPVTLQPLQKMRRNCLVVLAAWFGKTRLIDNTIIRDGSRYLRPLGHNKLQ